MKKNLIDGKRHFWAITGVLFVLSFSGCRADVNVETHTHEIGEELSGNEVADTTPPEGTVTNYVITVGIDETVISDFFGIESTDDSEVKTGFCNAKLIKTEDEVKTLLSQSIVAINKHEEIDVENLLDLSWEKETDTWYEENVTWENIKEDFIPAESGLYQLELVSVDLYGNANVSKCYVLADLAAPVFTVDSALEVTKESDMDANEFIQMMKTELSAEDNLLGNVSYAVNINSTEFVKESNEDAETKVNCTISDLAGNTTTSDYVFKVNVIKPTDAPQQEAIVANGHDRARAEQTFALINQQRVMAGLQELEWNESMYNIASMRAEELLSNYSHTRTATGRTTVEDYLMGENLNKVWGDTSANAAVQSWMNSQVHKDNLLTNYYTKSAVACYQNGKYCYYVQLFAY